MELENLIRFTAEVAPHEKVCIQSLLSEWNKSVPFSNKKILFNCHLTHSTLLLVELFLSAGAYLKVTATGDLVCHDYVKDVLSDLGVYVTPEDLYTDSSYHDLFDVVIDCGAYLANIFRPTKGFVELTHVDRSWYQSTNCPVISVDNSLVKKIETKYGTGDGFVRAMNNIYSARGCNIKDKNYLIFGFGKVGDGIATCLNIAGVEKSKITFVEISEERHLQAINRGLQSHLIYNGDTTFVKGLLKQGIDCAITATGLENSISEYFTSEDFENVEFLTNMGTYDEWGSNFSKELILHAKHPLNFMLEYPTKMLYLDPVFALLAGATYDLINADTENRFVVRKPLLDTQKAVLNTWLDNEHNKIDTAVYWMEDKDVLNDEAHC